MSSGQEPRSVRRETLPGENVGYQSQGDDGEMTETWGGGWVKIWPLETIKMAEMATRIFISVYDDIWMKVASWTTNGFLWTDAKLLYSVVALHKHWETLYEFLSRINCSCWLIWCESTVSLLRLSLKLAIASVNQKFSVAGRRFSLLWRGPGTEKLLFIFFGRTRFIFMMTAFGHQPQSGPGIVSSDADDCEGIPMWNVNPREVYRLCLESCRFT